MGFRLCPTAASSRRAGAITQRTPRSTETAGTQVATSTLFRALNALLIKTVDVRDVSDVLVFGIGATRCY